MHFRSLTFITKLALLIKLESANVISRIVHWAQ